MLPKCSLHQKTVKGLTRGKGNLITRMACLLLQIVLHPLFLTMIQVIIPCVVKTQLARPKWITMMSSVSGVRAAFVISMMTTRTPAYGWFATQTLHFAGSHVACLAILNAHYDMRILASHRIGRIKGSMGASVVYLAERWMICSGKCIVLLLVHFLGLLVCVMWLITQQYKINIRFRLAWESFSILSFILQE